MRGKSWYFSRKGRVEGPFTLDNLKKRIQLNDSYLVWSPSFSKWKTAEDFFTQDVQKNKLQVKSAQAKTELSRSPHIEQQSTQVIPKSSLEQNASAAKDTLSASIDRAQQALTEFKHSTDEGSILLNQNDPVVQKFTEQWNQLEQKQAAERRALLIRFFDENRQVESKHNALNQQTVTARAAARATANGSVASGSVANGSVAITSQSTPDSSANFKSAPSKTNTQPPSLRKKAAKQSRFTQETNRQSSRHLKPVKSREEPSQFKADGSRLEQSLKAQHSARVEQNNSRVESLQRTLKNLSGDVISKPAEKEESDHEAMMKRVNRRRRRRAR